MRDLFSRLAGKRRLTGDNIAEAVREIRLALLSADVNYGVAKVLIKRLKEKAIGDVVLKSVSPSQQFIKIVHDELVALMGGAEAGLDLKKKPAVILMCGLQGSGKTTHVAKLARYLMKYENCRKPLIAACDLQRPAAIEQLKILGDKINVEVFSADGENNPAAVAYAALKKAAFDDYDVLLVDTAGRLHVDDDLMTELKDITARVNPNEILFVANAATGQDAVRVAEEFNTRIGITGSILTMLDSDARGGAAISIREVTGKPLKFEGVGEKIEDIRPFNPQSMADRILGMGDTINLVRKAKEHIDEKEAGKLEKKLRSASFTFEDYLKQIQMVKRMGSLKSFLGMLPGMGRLSAIEIDDKEFFKVEAIIQSMTLKERLCRLELTHPRRRRIAGGSGTTIDDINRLVKSFKKAKQFFKNMPSMNQLQKIMGGSKWR